MREQDKYLCKVVVSEIDEYYGEVLNNSWEYANEVKPSVMFILDADIREAIFQNICESVCWDNLCIELTREYDIKKPYHQWELSDYFQFSGFATDGVNVYQASVDTASLLEELYHPIRDIQAQYKVANSEKRAELYDKFSNELDRVGQETILAAIKRNLETVEIQELEVKQILPKAFNAYCCPVADPKELIIHLPLQCKEERYGHRVNRVHQHGIIQIGKDRTGLFNLETRAFRIHSIPAHTHFIQFVPVYDNGRIVEEAVFPANHYEFNLTTSVANPMRELMHEHMCKTGILKKDWKYDSEYLIETLEKYAKEGYQSLVITYDGLHPSMDNVPDLSAGLRDLQQQMSHHQHSQQPTKGKHR